MENSQNHDLAQVLGKYAPAPNGIKENWNKEVEENTGRWEQWLEEYESTGIPALPGLQSVWTEGEVVKCVKYALENLPKDRLIDNGKYDRGGHFPAPLSMYAGRVKDGMSETLVQIASVVNTVSEILADTLSGEKPMSQACRERGMDYIRFRRFCEKFLQVRDGGKPKKGGIPEYEPTFYEEFYSKAFGVPADEASTMMPEDAEETVEYILSTLDEKEADIFRRHLSGEPMHIIGESYGVTRERIRQIELGTIRKLHSQPRFRILMIGKAESEIKDIQDMLREKRFADATAKLVDDLRSMEADREKRYSEMWIDELELSTRAYNCLKKGNINTVGELLQYDRRSLSKIRGMGETSLEEIENLLRSRGLCLRGQDK